MIAIIVGVVLGVVFILGALVGSEIQKHVLRGHEGTRADKLRMLRALRAEHVRRRRIELYGPLVRMVPSPRPAPDDDEKWWRRHPSGEGPVERHPDGPQRAR